ncbi:MAG TPA: M28 family peptidase [Gammaproteobacteria bacterium]
MLTRRSVIRGMALGAVAAGLPRSSSAQDDEGDLVARLRADLERHASFGLKFSAGPGDAATADWIAGRLREIGYAVEESEFAAPFFVQRDARLTAGSASADVHPQAPVVPTARGGVTAPLALVADDVRDVSGRIALFVTPFGRHAALFPTRGIGKTVREIAAAGASAVVVVTTGPTGEAIALNAPAEPFVPIPAAILAPKAAAPFVDAARAGRTATLVIDGDATRRPSRNVVARLARGRRWIVVSTPRSGWFHCVGERGTGTAAFLEMAAWARRRFPDLSVFLMNTGGHEYFFAGSHHVLDEAPPPEDTLAWAHIGAAIATRDAVERDGEWVMLDEADPQRSLMATEAAREAAATAFAGLSGLAEPAPVRPQAGELSTFSDRGYRAAFAVPGVHRWMHTIQDTLERVDARLVVPVLQAHQRTIELLVAARERG